LANGGGPFGIGDQILKGFIGTETLRDYTHASRTFRTNAYQYAPKFKFLFHVYFDINEQYINATFPQDKNFGLAVKKVQLPKYTIDVATLNQYNRKRLVQTKIKYDPINIVFHDDNGNLIRNLWYAYYSYYYKDPNQVDAFENTTEFVGAQQDLNKRNIYTGDISGNNDDRKSTRLTLFRSLFILL